MPRSILYATTPRPEASPQPPPVKRGPHTALNDADLLREIRQVLAGRPFHGEGHRKIHAILRWRKKIPVGRHRVLRLMRQAGLLAPTLAGPPNGDKAHAGAIVTSRPNQMWGPDATRVASQDDGWGCLFVALDHYCGDVVGLNLAKKGDRFQALEPIRQGLRKFYGPPAKDQARGLALRCDHGSQYRSDDFRAEVGFLGISLSYAFVGEPQYNGIVERFIRTLREQVLSCHRFKTLEEARRVIGEFIERYNRGSSNGSATRPPSRPGTRSRPPGCRRRD